MMTNKADHVLGIWNYILWYGTLDNKEIDILLPSNNEGSELLLEGYDGWDVGRPFCSGRMESKNNLLFSS